MHKARCCRIQRLEDLAYWEHRLEYEHIEVRFNDGKWSTGGIAFGLATKSVGNEAGTYKLGDLMAVASLARLM
jgi:hypothetical protein